MSLDLEALSALAGTAKLSTDDARRALDSTRATAEDLEAAHLRPLWAILEARIRERQPIDLATIRAGLPKALQEVALEVVVRGAPGLAEHRLGALREAAQRRRLVEAMRGLAVAARAGASLSELQDGLRQLAPILDGVRSRVRNCEGDARAMLDQLEVKWSGKTKALLTGLGELDEVLGGMIHNLYVIGARAGVGKSALVGGLVRNWVGMGVKTGVLCYEDDALDMQARIISGHVGIPLKLMRGDLVANSAQQLRIADGLEWWDNLSGLLDVDDARPSGSTADVLASLREMVDRGCRVVVLDNMTCVRMDGDEDRHRETERALQAIRDEAQRLKISAWCVGHIKRGEGMTDEATRPPRLSDFSNASAWENYARVALGMWRGEKGPMLRVLKQTNGPAGDDFDVLMQWEAAMVLDVKKRSAETPAPREERRYARKQWEDA